MPLSCCYERVGLCPGRGALRTVPGCRARVAPARKGVVVEVMYERVAGLDVGKDAVTVCVRTPGAVAGGARRGRLRRCSGRCG